MAANVRIKDQWKEQRLFEQRSLAAGAIIAALSVLLLARLVTLQVVRHDYYTDLSQGNRVRIEPLPAPRGLIVDRNGTEARVAMRKLIDYSKGTVARVSESKGSEARRQSKR